MAGVVLVPSQVSVTPGGVAVCSVRVRNTGSVVDSYTVSVVGDAAAWSTPMPAVLSLFPGGEGEATISFQPPRSADLTAGPLDFGVRVQAAEDPEGSIVEEGVLTIEPFVDFAARLTPRTSEAKRKAKHTIVVENRGNAPIDIDIAVSDPDEVLAFDVRPRTLHVEAGTTNEAAVRVAARDGFLRGADRHRPFQAVVSPTPAGDGAAQVLDATLVQRAGLPRFVPALVAAVVIVALAAVLLPGLLKRDSGTFKLSSADQAATTTVPSGDEGEEGDATAEAEAAAKEASGSEAPTTTPPTTAPRSGGGGTSAAGTGTAAGGTGAATATTTPPSETTAPTTPDEKPVAVATTTTTTSTTTTTTPPAYAKFLGNWVNNNASTGFEPKMSIRNDATYIWVHGYGACSPTPCDWGEVRTTLADANDNILNIRFNHSNGYVLQTIRYTSGTLTVHSDKYNPDGSFWYSSDDVFRKA